MAFAPNKTQNFNALAYKSQIADPQSQESTYLFQQKRKIQQNETPSYVMNMQAKTRVVGPKDQVEFSYKQQRAYNQKPECQSERNIFQHKVQIPQRETPEIPIFDTKKRTDQQHEEKKQYNLHKKAVETQPARYYQPKNPHRPTEFAPKLGNSQQLSLLMRQTPSSARVSLQQSQYIPKNHMQGLIQQIPEQLVVRSKVTQNSQHMSGILQTPYFNTKQEAKLTGKI